MILQIFTHPVTFAKGITVNGDLITNSVSYPELHTLLVLLIFSLICVANAYYIIGFNRACYFEYVEELGGEKTKEVDNESKMILWRVGYYSEKWFGRFASKPIYSCVTCMSSLWGAIPFWLTYLNQFNFTPISIAYYIFYTFVLAGLATWLNR